MLATKQPESLIKPLKLTRVLVVGCGAIGGIVAARLLGSADSLHLDVLVLSRNKQISKAVNEKGFITVRNRQQKTVTGKVINDISNAEGEFDWVILATQPPQVETAAIACMPKLSGKGYFVCLQNGLCEWRISKTVGHDRVLGAIVTWGASTEKTGEFIQTSNGGFVVGSIDNKHTNAVKALGRLLSAVGPVSYSDNLEGARWSKLALNCAVSTLGTLGGTRLGSLLRHGYARRLALEIMTELAEVANVEGVRLEPISGTFDLNWIALSPLERQNRFVASLALKHVILIAVGMRHRNLRSSMLRAIEAGREPAIDFLNGEVVSRAKRLGIATPINELASAWVYEISEGARESSLDTVHQLFETTRVASN